MLDDSKIDYDPAGAEVTYRSGLSGKSLLPKDTGRALSKIGRNGEYQGKPVKRVTVAFGDDAAAAYNADALAFLRLSSKGPSGVAKSDAKFPAREDFGIE